MYTPIKLEDAEKCLPWWMYENVVLTGDRTYVPFTMPAGYSYFLNHVIMQWPERNAAGLLYNNSLTVQMVDNSGNRNLQEIPVPPRLFSTPGSAGNTADALNSAAAGPGPSSLTIFNRLFYESSVLQLYIYRNSTVLWPLKVHVVLVGYTIKSEKR